MVEAPWVFDDAAGNLTMFYSGSQCCGHHAHYAVMVARSLGGPLGPWVKRGGASGARAVVLESDPSGQHVTAPGHNAVVRDDDGAEWMLYHANHGPQCDRDYCPRMLYLDRLYYNASDGDWPWTPGPTFDQQPDPSVRRNSDQ